MKRTLTIAALATVAALWAHPVHAVTQGFTYSGFLLDSAGNPVTTPTAVTFGFFDTEGANTTSPNFTEPLTVTPSGDGFFSAVLGLTVPNSFFHSSVWVTLKVGAEEYMLPRLQLTSSPGALSTNPIATSSSWNSATLVAGDNYLYATSVTLPAGGWCVVSTSMMITNGGVANTTSGPYYRVAIKRGATDTDDSVIAPYPGPLAPSARANMARSQTIFVNAGEATQFGCFYGATPADWVGDAAYCQADVHCL